MILHNGLGAPWQLAEGTFTVFSFCKVEGKKPVPALPVSHWGVFTTWYFTSGDLEQAEDRLLTFKAGLGETALTWRRLFKKTFFFFKTANIKQSLIFCSVMADIFKWCHLSVPAKQEQMRKHFPKGDFCFWISINFVALLPLWFPQRCFWISAFSGLYLILVNLASILEQC